MGGVGMPGAIKLSQFAAVVYDFFGATPYQVGSSLFGSKEWRDVDVRVILDDEDFDAMFGKKTRPMMLNTKWSAVCLAFATLGREMTGLPIDFQVQRKTEANEQEPGPRSALVLGVSRIAYSPHDDRVFDTVQRAEVETAEP